MIWEHRLCLHFCCLGIVPLLGFTFFGRLGVDFLCQATPPLREGNDHATGVLPCQALLVKKKVVDLSPLNVRFCHGLKRENTRGRNHSILPCFRLDMFHPLTTSI